MCSIDELEDGTVVGTAWDYENMGSGDGNHQTLYQMGAFVPPVCSTPFPSATVPPVCSTPFPNGPLMAANTELQIDVSRIECKFSSYISLTLNLLIFIEYIFQ
jgi:hypothetical protein